jgi:hypothetical protein
LYHYRARYYNPTFQRFVSQDPIGFAGQDTNVYAYVKENPTNWIDPYGLWTFQIGINFSGQFGPFSGSLMIGLVIDGQGNIGVIQTLGGVFGTLPPGGELAGGLTGGLQLGWSNAQRNCDLSGPFGTFGVSGGDILGGGIEGYGGPSPDGDVVGFNVTLGAGGGLMGYGPVSRSEITPLSLPSWQISGVPLGGSGP